MKWKESALADSSFFIYVSVSNNITELEVDMAKKSNAYTGGYEICTPKEQVQTKFNIQLVRNCMESILKDMAVNGMSYEK